MNHKFQYQTKKMIHLIYVRNMKEGWVLKFCIQEVHFIVKNAKKLILGLNVYIGKLKIFS